MKKKGKDKQALNSSQTFYGWWIVWGVFIVALIAPMGRYILSALFPFIQDETGWSRQILGLAFSFHFLVYAFMSVFTGRMTDSIGAKITIFMGGIFLFVGIILLSFSSHIWHVYLIFGGILSIGVSMAWYVPDTALIRKWFTKKAGLATGLVSVGTSIGFAVLIPIFTRLSSSFGWRTVCLISGIGIGGIIMSIAVFVLKDTPESMGLMPDGEEKKGVSRIHKTEMDVLLPAIDPQEWDFWSTIRSFNFWYLFTAYSVMSIALQGLLAHIVMWGVDIGFSPSRSGIIMAFLFIPSIPFRIIGGWLGDRFGRKEVLIYFNIFTMAVCIFGWLYIRDITSFMIFAILMGCCYSVPLSLYTPFLGDLFGRVLVGSLMGVLSLGFGIIGSVGPITWGWISDQSGSYRLACLLSAGCYLVVVISLCLIRSPTYHKKNP